MPESAIASGLVDEVLPVERMPEALIAYARRLRAEEAHPDRDADETSEILGRILALVRDETHIDLRSHRSKTLMRRIQRRMSLSHIDRMAEYLAYLREQSEAHFDPQVVEAFLHMLEDSERLPSPALYRLHTAL